MHTTPQMLVPLLVSHNHLLAHVTDVLLVSSTRHFVPLFLQFRLLLPVRMIHINAWKRVIDQMLHDVHRRRVNYIVPAVQLTRIQLDHVLHTRLESVSDPRDLPSTHTTRQCPPLCVLLCVHLHLLDHLLHRLVYPSLPSTAHTLPVHLLVMQRATLLVHVQGHELLQPDGLPHASRDVAPLQVPVHERRVLL